VTLSDVKWPFCIARYLCGSRVSCIGVVTVAAASAADGIACDADDVTSDVSLEEARRDVDSESSDDVTARYPAEVIVEGQQMHKVGHNCRHIS